MLVARDFQGLYAILPTPARPGADRFDATDTVDTDETARVIDQLIADGVSGLIVLGTTGECATLSQTDYETFVACVIETTARRVPVLVGATAAGGHEVVRRLRFVQDLGAEGTLLGMPMWQPVTLPMAVDYYRELSSLFPALAIMVYANARAFRFKFGPEFWTALAHEAPTVTSAKFSRPANLAALHEATAGRIHFMPNESTIQNFFALSPSTTTACWSTAAGMGPEPCLAILDAVRRGDEAAVAAIAAQIAWAHEPVKPIMSDPDIFGSYNIQLEKIRMDEAAYCRAGPVRPPYNHMPTDYAVAARACGQRWASLRPDGAATRPA